MRSGLSEGTRLDESQVLRISFPVSKGGGDNGDNGDSGGRSGNSQRMISAELAGQREVGEFMIRRKWEGEILGKMREGEEERKSLGCQAPRHPGTQAANSPSLIPGRDGVRPAVIGPLDTCLLPERALIGCSGSCSTICDMLFWACFDTGPIRMQHCKTRWRNPHQTPHGSFLVEAWLRLYRRSQWVRQALICAGFMQHSGCYTK